MRLLAALVAVLALVPVAVLALVPAGTATAKAFSDESSPNWAGYVVRGARFHRVSGAWRQPAVSCTRRSTYSAFWVGLGGFDRDALEQVGTEADCTNGRANLSAWYEMVPDASVGISMPVHAGDLIRASVTMHGRRVALALDDVTRHRFWHALVRPSEIDVSSAEWIVEAPSDCLSACSTLPLADFGQAVFTQAHAWARRAGVPGDWRTIELAMLCARHDAIPTRPRLGSFAVAYH